MKPVKETRYVTTFTVRVGTVRSVFDMMRYDNCFPATETDANKLAKLSAGFGLAEDHLITFTAVTRNPNSAPTVARWKSFGCEVVESVR